MNPINPATQVEANIIVRVLSRIRPWILFLGVGTLTICAAALLLLPVAFRIGSQINWLELNGGSQILLNVIVTGGVLLLLFFSGYLASGIFLVSYSRAIKKFNVKPTQKKLMIVLRINRYFWLVNVGTALIVALLSALLVLSYF